MTIYRFADCELDTDRHQLTVKGKVQHIEPQVFAMLELFAERPNRLITRDELIDHIWQGRVVSDSAVSVRINAARRAVGDTGQQQSIIRTVPRCGFKLATSVTRLDGPASTGTLDAAASNTPASLREEKPDDDKPAIAVFPFEDATGGEKGYFARGFADDIATGLSRFRSLAVISTFSSFQQPPERTDAADFAASLGATHIVTGSLRTMDHRFRLSVRLIEIATRRVVWSERYEIQTEELFEAQDDAVGKIVWNLVGRLVEQQTLAARRKPTDRLSAYDCVLRGLSIYKGGEVSLEVARRALFWFDRALALDPDYARAIAWRCCANSCFWPNPPSEQDIEETTQAIERAVAIDPVDHEVHRIKGALHCTKGEFDQADHHLTRSVELNPNDAYVLLRTGYHKSFLDDRSDLHYIDLAFQRNPLHPPWYWHDRGMVLFARSACEEALNNLTRSQNEVEANRLYRAACLVATGHVAEARTLVEQVQQANPVLGLEWIRHAYPYRCYRDPEKLDHLLQLFAASGLR